MNAIGALRRSPWLVYLELLAALVTAAPNHAQAQAAGTDTAAGGLWTRDKLLDDAGGLRTLLAHVGLSVGSQDTNEVFGNVTGGVHTGAGYTGLTMLSVGLDTKAAFDWEGGVFNVSALNIRGRNVSQFNLLSLQTASGIEADDATRLWEAWYQQSLFDGRIDVKLGQQSIDQEFMVSQGASTFLNSAMGWPVLPSLDMYAGGPSYPLSSLGLRLRARPNDDLTLMGGVFQDNPPGGQFNSDSQLLGSTRWGGNFNLRMGALFIAEAQYAINQAPDGQPASSDAKPAGLPGVYKAGFWYDTGTFFSPRYDDTGLPLASPASNGISQPILHNYSLYAVADQTVWQPDPKEPHSIAVFARIMGAPGNRNLIDLAVNAGVTLKAPLPTRDNDTFSVGFGFAHVSSTASGFNQDQNLFTGSFGPARSSETFVEVTYGGNPQTHEIR